MSNHRFTFGAWRLFTLRLLAASALTAPTAALAQVTAADANTTVYNAPNNVPVVDIANPNSTGLSHNRFNDYNVDSRGLVLNNNAVTTALEAQSQLAGAVAANTNLTSQANLILNEVVTTNRSQLTGFTEVLGGQAAVVVANPNGITCNGCGFINTPSATLTTGNPNINGGGQFLGVNVTGTGDILITGNGLATDDVDYLALVARKVKIDGQVNHEGDLDVVAGTNTWDHAAKTATGNAPGTAAPDYAIDSTALGGMYANKIRLIATEAGVGVRNLGEAAATASDFTITSAGQIELGGSVSAARDFAATSTSNAADAIYVNNGNVAAGRNAALTTTAANMKIMGTSTVYADGTLDIDSNTTTTLDAGAQTLSTGNTTITTTSLLSSGKIGSEAGLTVNANTIVNGNGASILSDGDMALNVNNTLTNNSTAKIAAVGDLTIRGRSAASYDVDNSGTIQAGDVLDIKGNGGSRNVTVSTDHANGKFIGGNGVNITSTAINLLNNTGITSQGDFNIDTNSLAFGGTGSFIAGGLDGTGTGTLTLNSGWTNPGAVHSGENLIINTTGGAGIGTAANGGTFSAIKDLTFNLGVGNLLNQGELYVGQDLRVNSQSFTNEGNSSSNGVVRAVRDAFFTLTNTFYNNNDVTIGRDGSIDAFNIINTITGVTRPTDRNGIPASWLGGDNNNESLIDDYIYNQDNSYDTNNAALVAGSTDLRRTTDEFSVTSEGISGLYDHTHYFRANWTEDEFFSGSISNRPFIVAGRDLSLRFNTGENIGGDISAIRNLTFTGFGGGASFTNDAMPITRTSYEATWNDHCSYSDLIDTTCDWNAYRSFTVSVTGTSQIGSVGANIRAGGTFGGTGFGLSNAGSAATPSLGSFTGEGGDPAASVDTSLPTNPNGLFIVSPNPNSQYLIETNPKYGLGQSVGSNYLLEKLGIDPEETMRRLGDANYEADLVKQQLISATGTTLLNGDENSDQQMARFMDNGAVAAKELGLELGKPLTTTQIANLKEDMVWMVETEVAGQKVLKPVVYLAPTTLAMFNGKGGTAQIAANDMNLDLTSLNNTGGTIKTTNSMNITSQGNIKNLSGNIESGGDMALKSTEGSIINETYASTTGSAAESNQHTDIGKTASIKSGGNMDLDANKNILVKGADVEAGGNANLKAGENITFDTIENKQATSWSEGDTSVKTESVTNTGSNLKVGGNLTTESGGDTTIRGSNVDVAGDGDMKSGGNINILAVNDTNKETRVTESSGFGVGGGVWGSEKITDEHFTSKNKGSEVNFGGSAKMDAKNDIVLQGSNLGVGGDLDMKADDIKVIEGRDIDERTRTVETQTFLTTDSGTDGGEETQLPEKEEEEKEYEASASAEAKAEASSSDSGDLSLSKTQVTTTSDYKSDAVGSGIKVGGNLKMDAKNDVLIRGSEVAADGDVDVQGKNVTVTAAENIERHTSSTTTVSVGFHTSSDNSADAGAGAEAHADSGGASASGNANSQGGGAGYNAGNAEAGASAEAGAHASTDNTVDLMRSETTTTDTKSTTHTGGSIKSGGNMKLKAENDLTVHGSDLEAGGDADLQAGRNMTFSAAEDTTETTTTTDKTKMGLYAEGGANADASAGANASASDLDASVEGSASADSSVGVGFYGSNTSTSNTEGESTARVSTIKTGGNLNREAGNKITDVGTQIDVGGDMTQEAASWDSKAAEDKTWGSSSSRSDTAKLGLYAEAGASAEGSASAQTGADHSADAGASAGVSASYEGAEVNSSESTSTAVVSNIKTGGNFKSKTTGATSMEGTNVDAGGDLDLDAGSIDYKAAQNTQTSSSDSEGYGGSVKVGVDATKAVTGTVAGNYHSTDESSHDTQAVVGSLKSGGNMKLNSAGDATFEGTNIEAGGDASVKAGGDLTFKQANDTHSSTSDNIDVDVSISASKGKGSASTGKSGEGKGAGINASGGFGHEEEQSSTAVVGNIKSGGKLDIGAGGNTTFEGTGLESGGDMSIGAGGDVNFNAAKSTESSKSYGMEANIEVGKETGKKTAGGFGLEGGYSQSDATTSTVSNVKSGGNLKINAGNDANFEGTNLEGAGNVGIDAKNDINFKAAEDTSTSFGVSASIGGGRENLDEPDAKTGKDTKSKGSFGLNVEGSDSTTKTAGSIKGGNINLKSGGDQTYEGTGLDSKGDTNINAGGDVSFKTADSSSIDGSFGMNTDSLTGVTNAGIGGGIDKQGSDIKTGGDFNITSGGKTEFNATQADVGGDANIDAKGGTEENTAVSGGGQIGLTRAGAEVNVQETDISAAGNVVAFVPTNAAPEVKEQATKLQGSFDAAKNKLEQAKKNGASPAEIAKLQGEVDAAKGAIKTFNKEQAAQ